MGRFVTILSLLWIIPIFSIPPSDFPETTSSARDVQKSKKLLEKADNLYLERKYSEAIQTYGLVLENYTSIKAPVLKKIALSHAALDHVGECVEYLEKALISEFNTRMLMDSRFDMVRDTAAFHALEAKYTPSFDLWSLLFLYVALIGFYIGALLNFNKNIDQVARTLISIFVLIHSIYILHIFLFMTNLQFSYPHTYLMSAPFSFLYGPLLYFYFKRITRQYTLRTKDLLHLVPTVLMLLYLIPIYALPASEKLALLLDRAAGFTSDNSTQFIIVVSLKIISFVTYGLLIRNVYLKGKRLNQQTVDNERWQRNIYRIHFLYIISYSIYGFLALNNLSSSYIFDLQIVCMALMVVYVGYSANIQPNVFSGVYAYKNPLFFKYEKSGLTDSLSQELMQSLIRLFGTDKIYKENDICLEMVAQRLNTTRHNASQVINEHFNMNFHELVNKYRIEEAKSILDTDRKKT
jgi:AraC-like DNA-binding protein